ncbi:MAG: hypothetical protein NTX16_07540 [Actinobacteria bacterium]|nr:hypothetical protein [Actinomycetota bacterium]
MAAPLTSAGSTRPHVSEARALLLSALVLLAGIALGAAGFFVERGMSTWRPEITRTASGWLVVQTQRTPLGALALGGDSLVWANGPLIVRMDLRSGRLKLLGPGPLARSTWDPAVSQRYVVWFEAGAASAGEASAWVYDSATRRRRQLATLGDVLSLPSASGRRAAWCTTLSDGAPGIVAVDIPTGEQTSVAPEYGIPVIDGDLVTWPTRTGSAGMPAAWALVDVSGGRRWSIVPAATLPNARLLGYDLSGRTLVWAETDPASGRGRVVAENVDDGAADVVAEVNDGSSLTAAPSIDGDLVVWAEERAAATGSRVMGRRLGGGPSFIVRDVAGRVLSTAAGGNTVAWLMQRGQTSTIETAQAPR